MFDFAPPRKRRPISLTPMIDVVFLLLIFFMLVSRFGADMFVPLGLSSGGASDYSGPPRLITVYADHVALNGVETTDANVSADIAPLMTAPTDTIILKPDADVSLERLLVVMDVLSANGFANVVLVE